MSYLLDRIKCLMCYIAYMDDIQKNTHNVSNPGIATVGNFILITVGFFFVSIVLNTVLDLFFVYGNNNELIDTVLFLSGFIFLFRIAPSYGSYLKKVEEVYNPTESLYPSVSDAYNFFNLGRQWTSWKLIWTPQDESDTEELRTKLTKKYFDAWIYFNFIFLLMGIYPYFF